MGPALVTLAVVAAMVLPGLAQATLGNKAIGNVFAYEGQDPNRIAFTPDGSKAYVTNALSDTVSVIDTRQGAETGIIKLPAGSTPANIAVSPDGRKAYVLNLGSHTVAVIDTTTDTVGKQGNVLKYQGSNPYGIAFHPDPARHLAYVTNNDASATVSVIDTSSDTQTGTIAGYAPGQGAHGVAFSPDGTMAYVATATSVAVIDVANARQSRQIAGYAGTTPLNVAFVSNAKAYVTNQESASVSVIDAASNRQIGTIEGFTGTYPAVVAVAPNGASAYVTGYGSDSVSVIDTGKDRQTGTVDMGQFKGLHPNGVAFRPDPNPDKAGDIAYVANNGSNSVSIIQVERAAAIIATILPATGTTLGGTNVTITGSNLTDSTGVTFAGTPGTNLNVVSNTELTVVTPPAPGGMPAAVDVVVQNGGGQGEAKGGYTYTTLFSR
ncbi:beta-propeller fold lactonase family protein [Bordetella flabilis]|uniref:IPT/TIG domain-containing protein n=1 Tax=Bordetella flabilis TaxID=463014 RepID=A0A193GG15_9BORD|nr:beta-propeller fold lactonase family protein [Bordetella flabilis]ANN78750.1 hypothetical protein BAU07_17955 [Bordetella flabilis]